MNISNNEIIKIIEGDTKLLVQKAEQIGRELKDKGLTTSQIRNIFGEVKEMEMKGFSKEIEKRLLLLKPKLAYMAARPGAKGGTGELKDILTTAINIVVGESSNKEEKFDNFCKFFEAILAYHRAAGGK